MSEPESHLEARQGSTGVSPGVLRILELLDNIAHVLVAIFFIVLAGSVLVYACLLLVRDMPLIVQPAHPPVSASIEHGPTDGRERPAVHPVNPSESAGPTPGSLAGKAEPREELTPHEGASNLFLSRSLELLSTLLFVVIVLELLKTIITYLKTHNIQAIMKEFLVVGIISSVRKILLVGAESSLGSTDPTAAYVKEATGTVITIGGILLLIAGLIFLQWSETGKPKPGGS